MSLSPPGWLIAPPDDFDEYDLGPLKAGKEAEVFLVERVLGERSCLLVHKRYRPRNVQTKGELQALGFQRSASFVNDHAYRSARRFINSRDQRAVDTKTARGRALVAHVWRSEEFHTLQRLSAAGVHVPYPVELTGDGILMEFIGDRRGAAPQLANAKLTADETRIAAAQLIADLRRMVSSGLVHADLSAYNLLWWQGQVWIIDVPQAVDLAANLNAFDFLLRDLRNVGSWFRRGGAPFDSDEVFASLLDAL